MVVTQHGCKERDLTNMGGIGGIRHNVNKKRKENNPLIFTCFRKLVMVFCISMTKSWKSFSEGSVLALIGREMFAGTDGASCGRLHTQNMQSLHADPSFPLFS